MREGIDPNTATWRTVKKWAEQEREKTRDRMEREMSHDATIEARGYCRALRALLNLPAETGRAVE